MVDFFLFGIAGSIFQQEGVGKSKKGATGARAALKAIAKLRKPMNDALAQSNRFEPPTDIFKLASYAEEILSLCNSCLLYTSRCV